MRVYFSFLLYISIYFFLKSPVLAAAPDIKHPFSRISPLNPPILPKDPRQLGEILQNTPLFIPQNPRNPTFYPLNPPKLTFSLKTLQTPYFFRFSILFHQKFEILCPFYAGRFTPLLFPIFPDFQEIIKFPALPYFFPIS